MAGYKPQKRSAADLLSLAQSKVDATATAVDVATGEVTTDAVWSDQQKRDWCLIWADPLQSEEIVAT